MQEAGNATCAERPRFKVTKRWPELYLGPPILLAASTSVYCFLQGQEGGRFWLDASWLSLVSTIAIAWIYALYEGRLRCRVSGDGWSVVCNNAGLLRELSAETLFSGDVVGPFVPVYRFQARAGVLLVRSRLFSMVKMVDALFPAGDLERALRKGMPYLRTLEGPGLGSLLAMDAAAIAIITVPFLLACTLFGSEAVSAGTWPRVPDPFRLAGYFVALFIGQYWACARWPRWYLAEAALFVDGKECIPLKSIVRVDVLRGRRSSLCVGYTANNEPRETRISQNVITQSLLPVYFFLRAAHQMPPSLPDATGATGVLHHANGRDVLAC